MMSFIKKMANFFSPSKNLFYISLAFWFSHVILRILLLFRSNPYGFPFVSKPDWYIFHAVCIDFLWIFNALLVFLMAFGICKWLFSRKKTEPEKIQKKILRTSRIFTITYIIFHSVVILFTLLDNEVQRFLGSHLTFGLTNTYKDASSIIMFWDYVANDYSVPFLQFFVLVLILPFTYGVNYLLQKKLNISLKKSVIAVLVFYIASFLFVNHIWTGNGRMTKLRPFVSIVYRELFVTDKKMTLSNDEVSAYGKTFQNLWQRIEGDSLWKFSDAPEGNGLPFYRVPTQELLQSEKLKAQRAKKPNIIIVFMESERGLNIGCLNPNLKPSPTPFIDSIAAHSRLWERMHTSGLPTTGGLLTSHLGISDHSKLSEATDLAHVRLPSYASVLTDSGYTTHYMSAADPAWDNLGVWMAKWYTAQHYNRNREDDSTFFDHVISYVADTLGNQEKPFLATIMTRSNHYPFNFAAGMPDSEKQKPLTERINYTMNYADRQLSRFVHAIENKDWYQNTYLIILADHGFPLGENGSSTMNGFAFSNATWIPFLIHGNGIEPSRDTTSASQIDIAPTLLELAGIAVPNIFMGHNLLRGYGSGYSLGAYTGLKAIGVDGYRLISKPATDDAWLFEESDTHQDKDLTQEQPQRVKDMKALVDTLIGLADFSLEKGL